MNWRQDARTITDEALDAMCSLGVSMREALEQAFRRHGYAVNWLPGTWEGGGAGADELADARRGSFPV